MNLFECISRLLSIADETLTEFISKATGTAVEWVQMPGMKPGPDSIGIVAISHGCTGIAARACGLVGLDPTRVAEILKDKPCWLRDCRSLDIVNVLSTANGGTLELIYMQLYAPTTLAPARDFWMLRYTSVMEDGSLVICERSLNNTQNGPSMPPSPHFVRAEILPSGYLIRPCEGGGSILHIVDHFDLEVASQVLSFFSSYTRNLILGLKLKCFLCFHNSFFISSHYYILFGANDIYSNNLVEIVCSHGVCQKFFVLSMSPPLYSPKELQWP